MDFDKDRINQVASIPHGESTSHPQRQVERLHQQQWILTP